MRIAFLVTSLIAIFLVYFISQWGDNSLVLALGLVIGFLLIVGVYDMFQTKQAVKRNFPVIGHFRYIFEAIRPEIQQYFVESNVDGRPINRNLRSVVYQRSKKQLQTQPFGTQLDVYEEGREWVCHSMFPKSVVDDFDRITIGNEQCKQPYSCSRFNISAMSYGALSKNAVISLNQGAKLGNFAHNTGEGGISPYHQQGGDLIWQIGTGYFGARNEAGHFCAETFRSKARLPEVKMIELKLSQGAKPGKGGILPGAKVTEEIAGIRNVQIGQDVISPAKHPEFDDGVSMLSFIQKLRDLSGGKPVGFKLCVGKKDEFLDIISAMKKTNILPDYIAVDGSEGGTGAAPIEFANGVGMPLKDGLAFVQEALVKAGLRNQIKLFAAGKSLTGFNMIRNFALGADVIYSARGMMLALGCIQALRCHSNHCPVGITTNNPSLVKGLVPKVKAQRVANYHKETLYAMKNLLSAMGKEKVEQVTREDLFQRQSDGTYKTFSEIYGSV